MSNEIQSRLETTPPRVPMIFCKKCGRPVDRLYTYCPQCGFRQKASGAWYYHPISLFVLGFFILGPFTLPLVWRSPQLNRTWKIVFTAAILVYTVLTFYYAYKIVLYELSMFSDLDQFL